MGVTKGFAGRKFSGSVSIFGLKNLTEMITIINARNPITSLIVKNAWNGTFIGLDCVPRGFLDPLLWRKIR